MRNPFISGPPVPASHYVQRRAAHSTLVSRIINYGQSTAVTGEPRVGKTSLLWYVSAPETRASLYGPLAPRLIFSRLMDSQNILTGCRPADFWRRALGPVYAHFGLPAPQVNHAVGGLPGVLLAGLRAALQDCDAFASHRALRALFIDRRIHSWWSRLPKAESCAELVDVTVEYLLPKSNPNKQSALALLLRVLAEQYPGDDLQARLHTLAGEVDVETGCASTAPVKAATASPVIPHLHALTAPDFDPFVLEDLFLALKAEGLRFVLLLDEYDCLPQKPPLHTPDFYGSLRSLTTLTGGALCVLLAGRTSLERFHQQTAGMNQGSPYFNYAAEVRLGAFETPEAEELLARAKDRFTPADRQRLVDATEGHPFLLQTAAAALWDAYDDRACADAAARWQYVKMRLARGAGELK